VAKTATSRVTVLFAGGGTGGHLMPGLSVAQELRRLHGERVRAVFVGTADGMERAMVEARGFEFAGLPNMRMDRSVLGMPRWAFRSARGLVGARRLVTRLSPDVAVSLGGHASLAPSVASVLSGVPLALMEQNAIPGKTNRWLSWWAAEAYAPWPGIEAMFARPERVRVTGNPIRGELLQRPGRDEAAAKFGLDPDKRTLLVMGGSLGALAVNRAVIEALPHLEAEAERVQILHGTGKVSYDEVRAGYEGRRIKATVLPFIVDMGAAYAVSDLVLCRAGGTSLAELTALGIPAVLVPLPIAANDHQRKNAAVVAGAGAALIVEQGDLDGKRLAAYLLNLLDNALCLSRMRAASLALGRPNAAAEIAQRLMDLLPGGPTPVGVPAEAAGIGGT